MNLKLPLKSGVHFLLALTCLAFGSVPAAAGQETLSDLVRSGHREAVLAAITSPDLDLDTPEADGSTALHWATFMVDHGLVKALLDAGATPNITNHYGSSPLSEAVKLGDLDLVSMLLDAGADPDSPNQDQQTALMLASFIGSIDIASLLIDRGADINAVESFRGQTALMWAAAENHPDLVELLINQGADVSVRAFHDDWPRQMTSEPRAQFRQTGGLTALLYATRANCFRCVVAMAEAGADINQPNPDGITPLLNAIDNHAFDIAMYLLDHGAKPGSWDMNGRTPLYVAVDMHSFTPRGFANRQSAKQPDQASAMDVLQRLLALGVDPNHQLTRMRPNGNGRGRFADYMMRGGTSPLLIAALNHDAEAMQALLAHGAEVDLANVFQITPLMTAAGMTGTGRTEGAGTPGDTQTNAIAVIDLLLAAGADINAQVTDSRTRTATLVAYVQGRDQEGRTALFAAVERGWDRVVAHLLEKGADPWVVDAAGQTALDVALAPIRTGPGASGHEEARRTIAELLRSATSPPQQ
jgi:uncharacterized protein